LVEVWSLKGGFCKGSENKENYREVICCPREYIYHHEQSVLRNLDADILVVEVSNGNEEHVIGKRMKDNHFS
jgi:hypothetical protein